MGVSAKNVKTIRNQPGVVFNEKGHIYTINGEKTNGSFSSVKGILNADALRFWAVNMTADYFGGKLNKEAKGEDDKWETKPAFLPDRVYTSEEINSMVEAARASSNKASRGAMDEGSRAHKWIDAYWSTPDKKSLVMPTEPPVLKSIEIFLAWVTDHNVKPIQVEWSFVHQIEKDLKIGCGMDLLAEVDGEVAVVDYKRSKDVYMEHYLQTAEYPAAAIHEKILTGIKLKDIRRIMLLLPPKGDGMGAVELLTPIERDAEIFIHLARAWQKIEALKKEAGLR
jgi:hypothetical protein